MGGDGESVGVVCLEFGPLVLHLLERAVAAQDSRFLFAQRGVDDGEVLLEHAVHGAIHVFVTAATEEQDVVAPE